MFTLRFWISTLLTLLICLFGIVGNLLCAVVLFSKHMHRSSYIYHLQGLTIADTCLLTLSSIRTLGHFELFTIPQDAITQAVIFFWDWISTSSTKYFTVGISAERFFVITFPLVAHKLLTKKGAKLSAIGIVCFTTSLSGFSYLYTNWIDPDSFPVYVAIVLHLVPFVLVIIFNFLIFVWLRKIRRTRALIQANQKTTTDDEYSVTIMLFVTGIVFGFCYSFEFVRRMMNYLWPEYMSTHAWPEYTINNLADIFYVLNSSVNFVIYCLLGRNFRAVLRKVFKIKSKVVTSTSSSGLSSVRTDASVTDNI